MIDIKLIRENPDLVRKNLEKRKDPQIIKNLNILIKKDSQWRNSLKKLEDLRKKRNGITEKIARSKKEGVPINKEIKEMKSLSGKIKNLEAETGKLRDECDDLLMRIPNLLHESVPLGKDDTENVEIRKWGKIPKFGFTPKDHIDLGLDLDIMDIERAAKVSGARFYYLKNEAVLINFALMRFALDFLRKKGFEIMVTPMLVRKRALFGTGFLPGGASDIYNIEGEDLALIGTSEVALGGFHMDEVLELEDLPRMYSGFSPCFRTEAGSHGRDTKGIFRTHEFWKVEQFIYSKPEESWKMHEFLIKNTEEMFQTLGIPYRIVNICTGDIGTVAAKKYDLEAWLPGQGKYREMASCSNCTDYQSRRLNVKYRKGPGHPPEGYVHTLNNTGIATPRALVAILENYQQKDGSVLIPRVLWPYMNGVKKLEKRA